MSAGLNSDVIGRSRAELTSHFPRVRKTIPVPDKILGPDSGATEIVTSRNFEVVLN